MTAPEIIKDLVKRFDEHRESYRSGRYNETQLRREFLDPFYDAKQMLHTPQEIESLQRGIESTDRVIDSLVYGLYGLSPDEIKIVEGKE